MKLSDIHSMYNEILADARQWPEPKNSDERREWNKRFFEKLPRIKYADLPASIKKTVRERFPVDELREFLGKCVDFDAMIKDIPNEDVERLIKRARNSTVYVIEIISLFDENEVKTEFAPVLYGDYAADAFVNALNEYITPRPPIQRKAHPEIIAEAWNCSSALKMPNSTLTYFFYRLMNAGAEGPKASRINRHERIGIAHSAEQNATQFTRTIKGRDDIITVYDPATTLRGSGKALIKLFSFMLQCWALNGYGREFSFRLQTLVDLGMYKSTDAARLAVKTFMGRQALIQLSRLRKKDNKAIGGTVFYNWEISNGNAIISVNDKMPKSLLADFFTMFPLFAYKLSTPAFQIVNYIMYLARQNGKELEANKGTFHVSIESVRQYLELPLPKDVDHYKYYEKIREPIESAIEEIEENMPDDYHFTIEPQYVDDASITSWLNGNFEIHLPYEKISQFVEVAEKAERHYKERERDKQQAEARAAAQKNKQKRRKKERPEPL